MGYRHNIGQNKTIANATYDALTRAHAHAAAATGAGTLIGNGGGRGTKVGRNIRKEWGRVILIAFAAAMLAVCISPVPASATYIPPEPANLANITSCHWVNYTWQAESGWHIIASGIGGGFHGYTWTGSVWQGDGAIASGLPDVGDRSAPTVFRKDGIWYLITGGRDAFHGYNWTGYTWQSDDAIVIAPPDVENYSAPTVFRKDGTWYLIAGDFHGYNWTGSAWQGDNVIASGLPDDGDNSTLAVFDMGNVTDSYNVSLNDRWYNGTTNTSINTTVGSGVWANISVWAWNASGAGTLSAYCVNDSVQVKQTETGGTFGIVGSIPTGGGGGGTYPPEWFGTPTPTMTATKALAASTTVTAKVTAADALPDERVTPTPVPTKMPAAAKAAVPAAEGTTAGAAKNGAPGFTAVFVITGLLAVAYAMMRRSR